MVCIVTGLMLSACAAGQVTTTTGAASIVMRQDEAMPGLLEPIHAAAFTNQYAIFRVSSNGCTDKNDIAPVISRDSHEVVITLRRLREDNCKALVEEGVELIWSFEELGPRPGEPVEINNPYQLAPES